MTIVRAACKLAFFISVCILDTPAITHAAGLKPRGTLAEEAKHQRACETGTQRLLRENIPRGPGASKQQLDAWVAVFSDCTAALRANPDTPWVIHDYAMFQLLAGGGDAGNDFHREGIRYMVSAVDKATAIHDVFTLDSGCRLLHAFHATGERECDAHFAAQVHADAVATVARLQAVSAEAERLSEEQQMEFESYRLLEESRR